MTSKERRGRLDALEKSEGSTSELAVEAAQILGIDLQDNFEKILNTSTRRSDSLTQSFKEQRVLRWAIRNLTTHLSSPATTESGNVQPAVSAVVNINLLLLLLQLLYRIPMHQCAEILVERKFLQSLATYLDVFKAASFGPSGADTTFRSDPETSDADSGRARKKRRLSPDDASVSTNGHSVDQSLIILRICGRCAIVVNPQHSTFDTSQETDHQIWAPTLEESAKLLASSLDIVRNAADFDTSRSLLLMSCIKDILLIWQRRPLATSEKASIAETAVFNEHLLNRLLSTLQLRGIDEVSSGKQLKRSIEELVAVHIIIPLRSRFNGRPSRGWKTQHMCLEWPKINNVYQSFMTLLGTKMPDTASVSMASLDWAPSADLILDIALRLLPQSDARKAREEQDWLDALLLCLCCVCCPKLSKLCLNTTKAVEVLDFAYYSELVDFPETIGSLLEVSRKNMYRPSIQALSYINAAILSWDVFPGLWSTIGKSLQCHPDILVTKTGIPTSDYTLHQLCSQLANVQTSPQQVEKICHEILIPAMQAFASARAMNDFIQIWLVQLQEAMRLTAATDGSEVEFCAVVAWLHEDLFNEFRQQITHSAVVNVGADLIKGLPAITAEIASRIGPTFDLFAQVALIVCLIQSVPAAGIGTINVWKEARKGTLTALQMRSDYQGQRWRLWTLQLALEQAGAGDISSEDEKMKEIIKDDTTSLLALRETDSNNVPRRGPAWYRECLERFSWLAHRHDHQDFAATWTAELTTVLEHLETLLSFQIDGTESPIWDGRMYSLTSPQLLVSACLGVIISRHEILMSCSNQLVPLLAQLFESSVHASGLEGESESTPTLKQLILSMIDVDDLSMATKLQQRLPEGSQQKSSKSEEVLTHERNLLLQLPVYDTNKPQAKAWATLAFQALTEDCASMSIEQLTILLASITQLGSQHSLPILGSDTWPAWRDVLRTCADRSLDLPQLAACSQLFSSIVRQILIQESYNQKTDPANEQILRKCHDMLVESRNSEDFVSSSILVRAVSATIHELRNEDCRTKCEEVQTMCSTMAAKVLKILGASKVQERQWVVVGDMLDVVMQKGAHDLPMSLPKELAASIKALRKRVTTLQDLPHDPELFTKQYIDALAGKLAALLQGNCAAAIQPKAQRVSEFVDSTLARSAQLNHELESVAAQANGFVEAMQPHETVELLKLLKNSESMDGLDIIKPLLIAAIILRARRDLLRHEEGSTTTALTDTVDGMKQQNQQQALSTLLPHLAKIATVPAVLGSSSVTAMIMNLENARVILEMPGVANQATVDALLGNLCNLLSSSSQLRSEKGTSDGNAQALGPVIYLRVHSILGVILSRFRTRLGDRYHLLLPVLQQSLRCLFYRGASNNSGAKVPAQGSNPVALTNSLPLWLKDSGRSLPPSCAESLSRLLSSICNPSVTAARSSGKRGGKQSDLKDETKRVRLLAGQHMQYLVMDYCRCTLDGEIRPDVKDKLMPGMYTVLDAMSRDLMKAMNAAMDPSSRAIFKGLYEDWVKHGRWDKS